MKPPIIGSCEGDVMIFDSVDMAKQHIEIIDVLEGSWKAWPCIASSGQGIPSDKLANRSLAELVYMSPSFRRTNTI
jgi:hypothetical protein